MPPVALHHRVTGPPRAETVLLGGALGSTLAVWDDVVADLSTTWRTVAVDLRGHGGSPAAVPPLTVADLAGDVLALADRLGVDRFHWVGLSLGGAVGQRLALDARDRLLTLTLACTSPRFLDAAAWHERARSVRAEGTAALRGPTAERWFTPEVRAARPERVAEVLDALVATDAGSYAAVAETLADFDTRADLGRIRTPTLVVTGDEDPTCPPEVTAPLAAAIPGAQHVLLAGSAHLAPVCRPAELAAAVRGRLAA